MHVCEFILLQRPPSPPLSEEVKTPPPEETEAPPPKPAVVPGPFSIDLSRFQLRPLPKKTLEIKVAPKLTDMLGPEVSMPVLQSRLVY